MVKSCTKFQKATPGYHILSFGRVDQLAPSRPGALAHWPLAAPAEMAAPWEMARGRARCCFISTSSSCALAHWPPFLLAEMAALKEMASGRARRRFISPSNSNVLAQSPPCEFL